MLSHRHPEGYVKSCAWRVGNLTSIEDHDGEQVHFCGIHQLRDILQEIAYGGQISTADDCATITRRYRYNTLRMGDEDVTVLDVCSEDQASMQSRFDILLADSHPPPMRTDTTIVVARDMFWYDCNELSKYTYPSTNIYESGLYVIADEREHVLHVGCTPHLSILESVTVLRSHLDLEKQFLIPLEVAVYPSQAVSPTIYQVAYRELLRRLKPTAQVDNPAQFSSDDNGNASAIVKVVTDERGHLRDPCNSHGSAK